MLLRILTVLVLVVHLIQAAQSNEIALGDNLIVEGIPNGGPQSQTRPTFAGMANYYINELGIAVIYPNVRGSSGYGKTFLKLDDGPLREDAHKDIGALLDWIKAQPGLDADRVMVFGESYGGYLT